MKNFSSPLRRDLPFLLTRSRNAGFALSALTPDERAFLADDRSQSHHSRGVIAERRCLDGDFMQSAQNRGGFSC